MPRPPLRRCATALTLALAGVLIGHARAASAAVGADPPYSFAVLSGVIMSPADEAPAQRLLDAIGRDRTVSFIVYDGNMKGPKEICRDRIYEQREALFNTSRVPLVLLPGQFDWLTCGHSKDGDYDPVERLDFLRQNLFYDPVSLGRNPLPLTRESEVARFNPYRENVRWVQGNVVFIGLNVPSPNNHYLSAGGRNGEFEDRVIANAFWIDHAAEFARRRGARALVIFVEGDPQFERNERERFAWLRFNRIRIRDGFHEFKRSLVRAASIFHGSILLVHASDTALINGFRIDRPLRNDKGELVGNLTRVAIAPRQRLIQWVRISVNPAKQPMFDVSVRDVPRSLPQPPALPAAPSDDTPLPPMPEIPDIPAMPVIPSPPALPGSGASDAQPPSVGPHDSNYDYYNYDGYVPGPASAPLPGAASSGSVQRAP